MNPGGLGYVLHNLAFSYGSSAVLFDITAQWEPGELVAVCGPNGAGKSTLLLAAAGLRSPYRGSCQYQGKEISTWRRRDLARQVSYVPQSLALEFPFTCEQVVLMGRAPLGDGLYETAADLAAARSAMERLDCLAFRNREFRTLSGGERQRVVLAAALAQEPRALLLDEPTTFLDLKHQLLIYDLLRRLAREGLLVVTITHDLNLALSFADRVLLLDQGRQVAFGPAAEVLAEETISRVFSVRTRRLERWLVWEHAPN